MSYYKYTQYMLKIGLNTYCMVHVRKHTCFFNINRVCFQNKKGRAPSPVLQVSISGRDPQVSQVIPYSNNPVFDEEFVLAVHNPECDDLSVRITDDKTKVFNTICKSGLECICISLVSTWMGQSIFV